MMRLVLYYKWGFLYSCLCSQSFLTLITLKSVHNVWPVSLTMRSMLIRNVHEQFLEPFRRSWGRFLQHPCFQLNVTASNFNIKHTGTSLRSLARLLKSAVCDFVWTMVRNGAPHLPRTQGSSLNFRWGSPPLWWWCSLCPSSSGGRGRRGTAPASAHPETAAACQTAGMETNAEARSSTHGSVEAAGWDRND